VLGPKAVPGLASSWGETRHVRLVKSTDIRGTYKGDIMRELTATELDEVCGGGSLVTVTLSNVGDVNVISNTNTQTNLAVINQLALSLGGLASNVIGSVAGTNLGSLVL
jgi:hypothetical protein